MINSLPLASVQVVQALGALHGFAALLACADPVRWNSLARPQADQLAAFVFALHGELEAALSDVVELPAPA